MDMLYYLPPLDFLCLTGIDACLGKSHTSSSSSSPCGKTEGVPGQTKLTGCGEDTRRVTGAGAGPGPHSLDRFPLSAEQAVSTCFSPRLQLKSGADLGSLQLCLGHRLLSLSHPLRISSQAILSALMKVWQVLNMELNNEYFHHCWDRTEHIHIFSCHVLSIWCSPQVGPKQEDNCRKASAPKLGWPDFLHFPYTIG